MVLADPEAFLRAMVAPLSRARPGQPLPGVPFSREAVANAFVMLGLLPGARAEEILGQYRPELEAKGFRLGVLTGELSVAPGALGYHEARAASRADLTGIPLAVAAGPVPIAFGGTDLVLTLATLTPGGVKLRLRAVIPDPGQPLRELPGQRFAAEVRSGLSVTDDLGRTYRLQPVTWGDAPGEPGRRRWRGEVLAEPQPAGSATGTAVRWLEFAGAGEPARSGRYACSRGGREGSDQTGVADAGRGLPGGTGIGPVGDDRHRRGQRGTRRREDRRRGGGRAAVDRGAAAGQRHALRLGGADPGLAGGAGGAMGRQAHLRARDNEPERAGLAVWLPLRRATAVIENIAAQGDLVSIQLYGHPWLSGEYWPMIVPSFQVRATDDAGAEHRGMPGDGGGRPEGSREFWFWPPVPPSVKRIRVTVSTLWEAAWAELDIPGRPG